MKSHPEKGGPVIKRMLLWVGVAFLYALPLLTVGGAVDYYLKINEIKGEVTEDKHRDWIQTFSIQHGVTRVVTSPPYTTKATEFKITKPVDRASPPFFTEVTTGTTGREVELEVVRDSPLRERFYRVKLYDALVSSFSQSSGGGHPTESIAFNYSKIELTYKEYDPDGNPTIATTAYYDVITGEAGLGNTAPTLSPIPDTTTAEDVPVAVNFTVGDAETAPANLTLFKSSSNAALVPEENIALSGVGSNRLATIQPLTNQSGAATITLTVSDGSLSNAQSFVLSVLPVNDPPQISPIPAQTTQQGMPITIDFAVNDLETLPPDLVLTGHADNAMLIPDANFSFAGVGTARSVTITPVPDLFGDTLITLSVSDGTSETTTMFALAVNQRIPEAPSDIVLSSQEIPENSPPGASVGLLSAVDPDSASHTFTLTDSAGGRFSIDGNTLRVNNGALLDYETAQSHTIMVKATDPDGLMFSKSLVIAVLNVNEAPAFVVADPSLIQTLSGVDTPITRLQVTDVDAGSNPVTLVLQVVNGSLTIGTAPPGVMISGNGSALVTLSASIAELNLLLADADGVIYQATPGLAGLDLLTAILNDNGHSGSGSPHIVFTTLGIRVYRDQYDQWLHEQFTEEELNNPALEATLWGFHADPDQDRLENLAEYGLGYPPRQNDLHRFPKGTFVEQDAQQYFSLSLTRRIDPNLSLAVQVSGDLEPGMWSSDPAQLTTFPPEDLGNGFERVRFDDRTPTTAALRRYMRIQWILHIQPLGPSQ